MWTPWFWSATHYAPTLFPRQYLDKKQCENLGLPNRQACDPVANWFETDFTVSHVKPFLRYKLTGGLNHLMYTCWAMCGILSKETV
jgi:hypothetical protein